MRQGDMTQGNIWKQLIVFATPLLFGNLLQQLYNAVDAIVVGNYVSNEALAAVGSTGPLINVIIAFFMGMSTGAGVLISRFYGAQDDKGVHDTVHTAILLAIIMGVALSVIGVISSPMLLGWMQTPKEIIPDAIAYLRIYFTGLVALTLYNMGTAILTATGDSRRPLYFLMISSVLHILGDLLCVNVLRMGIEGVAWSTVLSQAVSAVLVVTMLCRSDMVYKLRIRQLRLHGGILKQIVAIGLPGGIQQAIIGISNIGVQAYINMLGAPIVAGYSASTRLDAFIMLPAQTIALATSTFVAQNLGAKQVWRARRGTRNSLIASLACTVLLALAALLSGKYLLRIFTPDPQIIEHGLAFMKVFVPCYFMLCFTQALPGALRGAGDVKFTTITCIACYVGLRQLYLFFITQLNYSLTTVALAYPLTWAVAAVIIAIYYKRSDWSRFEDKNAAESGGAGGEEDTASA